ncbi:MAG: hypothetical protein JWN00_3687 [Actinomycetia bacterium]|jgi:hypothetical protein|nr:hypothetical protein [Actinomycetes bacterium]
MGTIYWKLAGMGFGVSVFLVTLGAILKFAISPTAMRSPVDIHVVGVILMIVGGVTFLFQLAMTARTGNRGGRERLYNGNDQPPMA